MEAIFLTVLNMSLTASWILLALFLLRFLLRRAPRWLFCLLWIPVALRLALPFTVESVLSLLPSGEPIPQEILFTGIPQVHTGIDAVNAVVNPFIGKELAPTPSASVNPIQVIALVAAILWIAGIALLLTHAVIGYLRLARRVQISAPLEVDGKVADPRIRICDGIDTPFILGIFRPRIYLPSAMDDTSISPVIAHEKAHLTRLDHLWKPLGYLLLTLHWFNPLVWIAYILFCRDLETACDEKVIRKMDGEDKAAYSEALLSCSLPKMRITACPLAFGEVGVKGRIKSILHYKKPTVWVIGAVVIAAAVLVVGFWTNPVKLNETDTSVSENNETVLIKVIVNQDLPDAPSVEESCFYAHDSNGTVYRINWANSAEIQYGQFLIISYKTRRTIESSSHPLRPDFEVDAIDVTIDTTISSIGYFDAIRYDYDGDGIAEEYTLGFGPTYGLFTFSLYVSENGELLYHDCFLSEFYYLSFVVNQRDQLQVQGITQDDPATVHYFDISFRDGRIVLTENGTELSYYGRK